MKLDPRGLAAATAACRDYTFDALTMDECRDVVKLAVTAYLDARVTESCGDVFADLNVNWRPMGSAPRDGSPFVAIEKWSNGNTYARVYKYRDEIDYWVAVEGGTCIHPDYWDRYLWTPLP